MPAPPPKRPLDEKRSLLAGIASLQVGELLQISPGILTEADRDCGHGSKIAPFRCRNTDV